MHILDTERLRLRTLMPDDAPFYLAVVNTQGFIEFIGDRGIRTVDAAREAIASGAMAMQATLGHSLYLVERKEDGAAIGMCGLIKRDTLTDVDIGYAYLPQFGGKGYATEAAAGVLAYAPSLGIRRLLAITSPGNVASNAVLRKIGMRFQDLVHLTPEDTGTLLYSHDFPAL
ncbi:MAG TPA: GNAT family N-acetyltransferase [Telluria sp.]|nr:GNAT family N-acetyltransferase [Telluria sp.]